MNRKEYNRANTYLELVKQWYIKKWSIDESRLLTKLDKNYILRCNNKKYIENERLK